MLKKTMFFCCVFMIFGNLNAQQSKITKQQVVTQSQRKLEIDYIKEIENFFNNLKTFTADFIQVDRAGRESTGRFLMKRPGFLKMDYLNPAIQVIIVKNNRIIHYDKELKEKTITSAYSSPLSFFLDPVINLRKTLKVLDIKEDDGTVSVTFCKKNSDNDDDSDGAVSLVFSKSPFMLMRWEVYASKNHLNTDNFTQIILINQELSTKISYKEFDGYD